MMNNMMPYATMNGIPLLWILIGLLLGFLLAATIFLLWERGRNAQRPSQVRDARQPQDVAHMYEQGYQPLQQVPEVYQEGGQYYSYPRSENEQPTAEYPQEMPLQQ
jgi:hypothetical protein